MNKINALTLKTLLRVFRQLHNVKIGLTNEDILVKWLDDLQQDYLEEMACIMEEIVND